MRDLYESLVQPYETVLARMKDKFTQLAGYPPDDASDIGIRMKVLAGEIYSASCAQDWLCRQTFVPYATGKQLEYHAAERGLSRKPAAAASGVLTFSRKTALWYDVKIPAGTLCATSGDGAVQYETGADAVLQLGRTSVDVPASAQAAGTGGNTEAGTVCVMLTVPSEIESVTNAQAFTGGSDAESDEDLRARLLACWQEPANSANAAWYRKAAESCAGVHSAQVVPCADGAGTVTVFLGGDGKAAPDAAVQTLQAVFNEKRELGTAVTVKAAQTVPVDVSFRVSAAKGENFMAASLHSQLAVNDYFRTLNVGDPVVISALTVAIFATGFVSDCVFTSVGKAVQPGQLAVPGNIDVEA